MGMKNTDWPGRISTHKSCREIGCR